VEQALRALSGEIVETEADRSITGLSTELKAITADRDTAVADRVALSEKVDAQARELEALTQARDDLTRQLASRKDALDSLQRTVASLTKEKQRLEIVNTELRQINDQQKQTIDSQNLDFEARLREAAENYQHTLSEKVASIEDQFNTSKEKADEELKRLRKKAKVRILALKSQLTAQGDESARLQEELDAINAQFSEEVSTGQDAANASQREIQRLEAVIKELKGELSASQIDQRMLALKLQNSEEQIKRDRSLAATRSQLADLGLEAAHQAVLEDARTSFDAKFKGLLESISASLGEFASFPRPISEESIQEGIAHVGEILRAAKQQSDALESARTQIAEIRGLLEIDDQTPLAPVLAELLKNDGPSWEEWAQRVHALVTNSFSLVKTKEELQYALEEALMASTRQTKIARKLEVLRFEKKLLVASRLPLQRSERKAPTLLAVLSVIAAVRKLQKLTGSVANTQI
jgi:DNA repair exonuclease SbcCD ATPase subunit